MGNMSDQALLDYLSRISHDMKTPLNSILGFVSLLEEQRWPAPYDDYLRGIMSSTNLLKNLIASIMDAAKAEGNELQYKDEPFRVYELLEDTLLPFKSLVDKQDLSFNILLDKSLKCTLIGDSVRLVQVIHNLVSNAIAHTEFGEIEVKATVRQLDKIGHLVISVSDTGYGIPKEDQQAIFDPFFQSAHGRSVPMGTGLGLSISRHIVEHYEGQLQVISEVGRGSVFTAIIPMHHEQVIETAESFKMNAKEPTFARTTKIERILIAEDNMVNQKLMSAFMERFHLKYDIAVNGLEALELLADNTYDLILMDCQMPIMDGYETTKEIRRRYGDNIFIVALTAFASEDNTARCYASGMNDVMSKPFDMEAMMAFLKIDLDQEHRSLNQKRYYDLAVRSLMEKIQFDLESSRQLMDTFIDQSKEMMDKIGLLIKVADYQELSRITHQFKGAAAAVRQEMIRQRLMEMESCLKEQDLVKYEALFENLKKEPLLV